jgi:hypothetical protein
MLSLDAPSAQIQWGAIKFFDTQLLKSRGRAHNIHDCINRADFMKVHFLNRDAVDERLGIPQPLKYARRFLRNRRRQPRPFNQLKNFGKRPVPLRIGGFHFHLCRPESTPHNFFG